MGKIAYDRVDDCVRKKNHRKNSGYSLELLCLWKLNMTFLAVKKKLLTGLKVHNNVINCMRSPLIRIRPAC